MELDDVLDLLANRRDISREEAYQLLLTMPGGGELVTGRVSVEDSPLVSGLLQDDPG